MGAAANPSPKLAKSTALSMAQNLLARVQNLVPSLTTVLSPVTVYQPGATVGGQLTAPTTALPNIGGWYGVWVAPDLNNGSPYSVQVECFGGGGGAGGGAAAAGGGGGGGGEYACEPQYLVTPGESYTYVVGLPGSGGFSNSTQLSPGSAGTTGGDTVFDLAGLAQAGGVYAHGGQGGDQIATGIGGTGGTGSSNTNHFNGGNGGTNNSSSASDNPVSLVQAPSFFQQNTLSTTEIVSWYVMDDGPDNTNEINDQSLSNNTGKVTNRTGGLQLRNTTSPTQVPTATAAANPPLLPNPTTANVAPYFKLGSLGAPSSSIQAPGGLISGKYSTISGWVKCDPSGTWGNTPNGSYAVLAANGQGYFISGTGTLKGHALLLYNAGTAANPNWQLYYLTGNGTNVFTISSGLTPTPGTWYYIVATYNNGTMTLYVNGSSVATVSTSVHFTSVPAGTKAMTLGTDPNTTSNWYFGYMSNFWFANDAILSAGILQAFGTTPATGGAGGGASGGPSANGGNGAAAAGASAGAGGTPATQPASLASVTTAACGGYAGAGAGLGNAAPVTPAGGPYGGGGGGSGDMPANPALTVLTVQFTTAAAYCGPDAQNGNANAIYNVNQQNHPAGSLNSVLYAGGLASDTSSGSKNSMLILPKNLSSQLGNTVWTITQVFLTFTNAFPTNSVESILELGYSSDTVLPQTYNGSSLIDYVGAIPIPVGAGVITYDLTESSLTTFLQNGTATALIMGPGANPAADAYNAPTGAEFYASIYGPGAADTSGNAQYPYLTIVLEKTLTTQQGSAGIGGGIVITSVNNANTPVTIIEPFAGSDASGNGYGLGVTTQKITAFNPADTTPGSFAAETWHTIPLDSGWLATGSYDVPAYRFLPDGNLQLRGAATCAAGFAGSKTLNNSNPIPGAWLPANLHDFRFSDATGTRAHLKLNGSNNSPAGVITAFYWSGGSGTITAELDAIIPVP